METVGIRELKNRLSAYIRRAEAGDVILVTDRGRVVAELVPPARDARLPDFPPGFIELARRGELRLPTSPHDPELYRRPLPRLDLRGQGVQELLDWMREDKG